MARGCITKRSNGSWALIIDIGRDPVTRKRRQKWLTVRGTKRDAEKKMSEVLHELDTGVYVEPSKLTLADYLERWLKDYASIAVRPRTLAGYRQKLTHVTMHLGSVSLSELRPDHLQGLYRKLLENGRVDGLGGLSPRSVMAVHRVVYKALRDGVKWGLLVRNPAETVDPPRPVAKEMKTLDASGVARLFTEAQGTPYYSIIHLAVYTGLRRSELLALRWRDIDFASATLSVTRGMHVLKGGKVVYHEPKSGRSRRQVALSPNSVLSLRVHRERVEADAEVLGVTVTEDSLIFAHPDGRPMLPDTLSHAFIKIRRRAGLAGVRLHDLRHTSASLMLKANIHPKVVQERLGHSSIAITLDLYSHVAPGMQEAAALKLDEELAESRVNSPVVISG